MPQAFTTPPFAPGTYLTGTRDGGTTLDFLQYEGMEFDVSDTTTVQAVGPVSQLTPLTRRMRIVRNMSATAVTAKQVLIPSTVSGYTALRTVGPQTTAGDFSYIADPYLQGSCPQYGLFWIVVYGPAYVLNAAGADNEGDIVVSTTTSGEAATIAAGSITARQAANYLGRCTSAISGGAMGIFVGKNP